MSKGGHTPQDPNPLTDQQRRAIQAPIQGQPMNTAPMRGPMMLQHPGLFGLSGAMPAPANVTQLNMGPNAGQPPQPPPGIMSGGGKGGALGGPGNSPWGRGNPGQWNPWGAR